MKTEMESESILLRYVHHIMVKHHCSWEVSDCLTSSIRHYSIHFLRFYSNRIDLLPLEISSFPLFILITYIAWNMHLNSLKAKKVERPFFIDWLIIDDLFIALKWKREKQNQWNNNSTSSFPDIYPAMKTAWSSAGINAHPECYQLEKCCYSADRQSNCFQADEKISNSFCTGNRKKKENYSTD